MTLTRTIGGLRGVVAATLLGWAFASCGGTPSSGASPAAKEAPPAKVTGAVKEADLATVALSEEAERRLGIEVVTADETEFPLIREVAGELMVPPGRTMLLSATSGGTLVAAESALPQPGVAVRKGQVLFRLVPLVPIQRDLLSTYQAEVTTAQARFDAARQQRDRAQQLVKDRAGSQRSLEQAEQEYRQAEAALQAATGKIARLRERPLDADVSVDITAPDDGTVRQVFVAPGVQVSSGTPLVEVVNVRTLWIRVPVYAGDVAMLDSARVVPVEALGSAVAEKARTARRVQGPPSADPVAVSVDVYYEVENADRALRPGEKVRVALPLRTSERGIVIPASAVVYDQAGGTWAYARTAPHQYQRRRIQVVRSAGGRVLIGRGLQPGESIVTVGVAEIFGTEFGAGK